MPQRYDFGIVQYNNSFYLSQYLPLDISFSGFRSLATLASDPAHVASTSNQTSMDSLPRSTLVDVKRAKTKNANISTAIVLNRSPIITRSPSRFELAYYAYSSRIRRALSNPFPHRFYFKQGSLLQNRFLIQEREREKTAWGPRFWTFTEEQKATFKAQKLAEAQLAEQEGEQEKLMPREHPGEKRGALKSLNRQMMRNLYLLIQPNESRIWRFPQGTLQDGELLHQVTCLHCPCATLLISSVRLLKGAWSRSVMNLWIHGLSVAIL
jgi:hypothetical protein